MENKEAKPELGGNPDCPFSCDKFCQFRQDLVSLAGLPSFNQLPKVDGYENQGFISGFGRCANDYRKEIDRILEHPELGRKLSAGTRASLIRVKG